MSTFERLTEVFNASQKVSFDDTSKFIFFSDVHRGDNSWTDDFSQNQGLYFFAMCHYFEAGFTYVEIGDGDELLENRNFAEIRLQHSDAFWIMREFYNAGRLHLIHGNHDMERADPAVVAKTLFAYQDERTGKMEPLFPDIKVHEGLILHHVPTGGEIFMAHGNQGDGINDNGWELSRFIARTIWWVAQFMGVHDPTSPAKNFKKRTKLEQKIQEWVKARNQPIMIGHTHRPSFPDEGCLPFFNTGSCVHPRCITGIEIENGNIQLIKWWFKPDEAGKMTVTREILEGPRKVSSIFES